MAIQVTFTFDSTDAAIAFLTDAPSYNVTDTHVEHTAAAPSETTSTNTEAAAAVAGALAEVKRTRKPRKVAGATEAQPVSPVLGNTPVDPAQAAVINTAAEEQKPATTQELAALFAGTTEAGVLPAEGTTATYEEAKAAVTAVAEKLGPIESTKFVLQLLAEFQVKRIQEINDPARYKQFIIACENRIGGVQPVTLASLV